MTTAFVLSGGASLGAVQAGMLQARLKWGARPDLVVGTSVGAISVSPRRLRPGRRADRAGEALDRRVAASGRL